MYIVIIKLFCKKKIFTQNTFIVALKYDGIISRQFCTYI